ncbi:MAG: archaellin/type IV pilin N-terminal domain-containing protein [Nanoarchaeota archaeon]
MRFLNKKGISPLIATVLLIGFTVALAGVVITWGGGFVKSVTTGTEEKTEETLACAAELKFEIDKVICGSNITDTNTITPSEITIDNRGVLILQKITFRFFNEEGEALTQGLTAIGDEKNPAVGAFELKKLQLNIKEGSAVALIPNGASRVDAITTVVVGGKNISCGDAVRTKKFKPACIENR